MTQMGRWFGYRDNYDDYNFHISKFDRKFRKFYSQKKILNQIMNLDTGKYTPRPRMYIVMYAV